MIKNGTSIPRAHDPGIISDIGSELGSAWKGIKNAWNSPTIQGPPTTNLQDTGTQAVQDAGVRIVV